MKHAIEILEKELEPKESTEPYNEDYDDIYSAVASFRRTTDIRMAIKVLKQAMAQSDEIHSIK